MHRILVGVDRRHLGHHGVEAPSSPAHIPMDPFSRRAFGGPLHLSALLVLQSAFSCGSPHSISTPHSSDAAVASHAGGVFTGPPDALSTPASCEFDGQHPGSRTRAFSPAPSSAASCARIAISFLAFRLPSHTDSSNMVPSDVQLILNKNMDGLAVLWTASYRFRFPVPGFRVGETCHERP